MDCDVAYAPRNDEVSRQTLRSNNLSKTMNVRSKYPTPIYLMTLAYYSQGAAIVALCLRRLLVS